MLGSGDGSEEVHARRKRGSDWGSGNEGAAALVADDVSGISATVEAGDVSVLPERAKGTGGFLTFLVSPEEGIR